MMKNLFFAAAVAALACAGCAAEDEGVTPAPPQEIPVNFSTSIAEVTRGIPVEGKQFGSGAQIGIFGTETLSGTATSGWMDNVCLTWTTGGIWNYTTPRYFMGGYKYSFKAYAPYMETGAPDLTDLEAVSYSVTQNITDQVDFMYANQVDLDFAATAPTADNAKVQFAFKHALAQVKFSALTAKAYSGYTLKIKKISMADISSVGTLKCSAATWSAQGTPLPYEETLADLALSTTKQELKEANNHVLMLIPQDPAGKKMTLTFDIIADTANGGDASKNATDETVEVSIPAGVWDASHVYDYKITLNLDATLGVKAGISNPTITEWGTPEEIDVPVEK